MGFCSCSMFWYALLCVHSGLAIILMEREELVALVSLSSCVSWLLCCSSSWCHVFICSLRLWYRPLRLISHVTHIKHVFFHFVVYIFFKDISCFIVRSIQNVCQTCRFLKTRFTEHYWRVKTPRKMYTFLYRHFR